MESPSEKYTFRMDAALCYLPDRRCWQFEWRLEPLQSVCFRCAYRTVREV